MNCSKCGTDNSNEATLCEGCRSPLLMNQREENVSALELVLPASLNQRFVHFIVDRISSLILFGVVLAVVTYFWDDPILWVIIFFIITPIYYFVCETLFQKTIGKMVTGMKVVDVDGNKPSFFKILIRTVVRYIPLDNISFLFYGAYPTKGWHDRLSRTLVVPSSLTPEQVRMIDPVKITEHKKTGTLSKIIIVATSLFVLLPILALLLSFLFASYNSAQISTGSNDAQTKLRLNGMRSSAEAYYGFDTGYSGLCENEAVATALEIAFSRDYKSTKGYTCNDSATAYVITVQLNNGQYFCIDSVGSTQTLESDITTEMTCR